MTKGGATLVSTTVTTTSWSPHRHRTRATPRSACRAVMRTKPGKGATVAVSVRLADVTAPPGSFTSCVGQQHRLATITQESLTDDSRSAGITRTVDWDDGTSGGLDRPGPRSPTPTR